MRCGGCGGGFLGFWGRGNRVSLACFERGEGGKREGEKRGKGGGGKGERVTLKYVRLLIRWCLSDVLDLDLVLMACMLMLLLGRGLGLWVLLPLLYFVLICFVGDVVLCCSIVGR